MQTQLSNFTSIQPTHNPILAPSKVVQPSLSPRNSCLTNIPHLPTASNHFKLVAFSLKHNYFRSSLQSFTAPNSPRYTQYLVIGGDLNTKHQSKRAIALCISATKFSRSANQISRLQSIPSFYCTIPHKAPIARRVSHPANLPHRVVTSKNKKSVRLDKIPCIVLKKLLQAFSTFFPQLSNATPSTPITP